MTAWRAVISASGVILVSLALTACSPEQNKKSDAATPAVQAEHPKGEHPEGEHPKGSKAKAEHPEAGEKKADHPKSEHPSGEHPR